MKIFLLRASLFCALLFGEPVWAVEDMTNLVLQNAVVADGNGKVISVGGYTTVAVDVAITTTATVNFEGGTLGSAISSVNCIKVGDVDAVAVISTTASGLYQCNIAGLTGFRARVSNWSAGAVTVIALATTAPVGGGGGGSTGGSVSTATAAAPSYAEGSTNPLSTDIYGNLRTTLGTLLSGEIQGASQSESMLATSGGAVRQTTVMSAVTTDTTSAVIALPTGNKSLYGQVVCDSGACTQTQAIYGDVNNDAANGVLLCTLTLSGTTRDQAACSPVTANFSFYYVVTTNTSGTNAAGAIYGMY